MLVLTLIGILAAASFIYGFIQKFNDYTREKARYVFFSTEHSIAMVISYGMIFFGQIIFMSALHSHGDCLNGSIITGIGMVILVAVIVNNFSNAPKHIAIMGSIMQVILYIPIAAGALFILFIMFAYFSQTKPVYNVNSRD